MRIASMNVTMDEESGYNDKNTNHNRLKLLEEVLRELDCEVDFILFPAGFLYSPEGHWLFKDAIESIGRRYNTSFSLGVDEKPKTEYIPKIEGEKPKDTKKRLDAHVRQGLPFFAYLYDTKSLMAESWQQRSLCRGQENLLKDGWNTGKTIAKTSNGSIGLFLCGEYFNIRIRDHYKIAKGLSCFCDLVHEYKGYRTTGGERLALSGITSIFSGHAGKGSKVRCYSPKSKDAKHNESRAQADYEFNSYDYAKVVVWEI